MNKSELLLARLDRLPVWPYPKKFLLAVGMGFMFSFFDIITIALVIPKIAILFGISQKIAAWAITSSLFGYIIGSFCIARLSDFIGRRLALFISVGFFSLGSVLTACSRSFHAILIWRLITGIGIGSEISGISTYLSEMSPAACRGRYTTLSVVWGFVGSAGVPFVGLALIPHFEWGWRLLFLLGGLGGLITLLMRKYLPDSPRWLIAKGKLAPAEKIIQAAEAHVAKRIPLPPLLTTEINNRSDANFHLSHLVTSPYGGRIILFIILWCCYYIGNYGWSTLTPTLFTEAGFTLSKSLLLVGLSSLGFIAGSLYAAYIGDSIERKQSIFAAGLIWTCSLLCIGFFPQPVFIISLGFIAACTLGFMLPLLYTYTAEHFPTQSRATSVAITDGLGHLGGAFCGQIVFGIAAYFSMQFAAAFTVMACSGLLTALLVLLGKNMTGKNIS